MPSRKLDDEWPGWMQAGFVLAVAIGLIAFFAALAHLNPPPDYKAMAEKRRVERQERSDQEMRLELSRRLSLW